jgi:hypothetical protein
MQSQKLGPNQQTGRGAKLFDATLTRPKATALKYGCTELITIRATSHKASARGPANQQLSNRIIKDAKLRHLTLSRVLNPYEGGRHITARFVEGKKHVSRDREDRDSCFLINYPGLTG